MTRRTKRTPGFRWVRQPGLLLAAAGAGAVAGAAIGIFAFLRLIGGSGAPSQPISAPAISGTPLSTVPLTPGAESTAPVTPNLTGQALFQIVPEESEVRFIVGERDPFGTVVGVTDQVAGEIAADFDETWRTRIGTIRINVRTLQTDDRDRDQSLRAGILESARDEYEFAEFTPTVVEGIPVRARVGSPMRVEVRGDFNVHGVVRPIVFFGIVTFTSPDEMRGFLAWAGAWSEFSLFAEPLVSHLVSEEFVLEIDFVARKR